MCVGGVARDYLHRRPWCAAQEKVGCSNTPSPGEPIFRALCVAIESKYVFFTKHEDFSSAHGVGTNDITWLSLGTTALTVDQHPRGIRAIVSMLFRSSNDGGQGNVHEN